MQDSNFNHPGPGGGIGWALKFLQPKPFFDSITRQNPSLSEEVCREFFPALLYVLISALQTGMNTRTGTRAH